MALTTVTSGKIASGILKYNKTFTQLAAPGSTDHINVPGTRFHTFQTTVASINTNVLVQVEGSIDGTNFYKLPMEDVVITGLAITSNVATITANGTYLIYVKDIALEHVRYTFVSETGGTAATIDVKYYGSR